MTEKLLPDEIWVELYDDADACVLFDAPQPADPRVVKYIRATRAPVSREIAEAIFVAAHVLEDDDDMNLFIPRHHVEALITAAKGTPPSISKKEISAWRNHLEKHGACIACDVVKTDIDEALVEMDVGR